MELKDFKNRNVSDRYVTVQEDNYPKTSWDLFKQVLTRSVKGELFVGMRITFGVMYRALFKGEMATVQYPKEKLPIGPRYSAVHKLLRLLESGEERCIGCGLCEKICIANCIRMETKIDENSRKAVTQYTINMGRCIFCGYCAEVCPELAIVHGGRYENASEQRAHFSLKEDILTSANGLCEKICIANCIRMETRIDENSRKEVLQYTINMGRCIFCGYCAEVCPELAIVHGGRYENSSEQRAHFSLKEDILTSADGLGMQLEFQGFGSVSSDADKKIKKTPLSY